MIQGNTTSDSSFVTAGWVGVRSGFRHLVFRREPFMVSAVLVLGLGLCAFLWFSSLLYQAYRQELPGISDPHELVRLELRSGRAHYPVSLPLFDEIDRNVSSLHGLAASTANSGNVLPAPGMPARRLSIAEITPGFFTALGVKLFLGTAGGPASGDAGSVCVVSYRLWKELRNLGVEPIGHAVQINGEPFTVTGVAPAGFHGASWGSDYDIWVPVEQGIPPRWPSQQARLRDPTHGIFFTLIGRTRSPSPANPQPENQNRELSTQNSEPKTRVLAELNQLWSRFDPVEWGYEDSADLRWLVDSDYGVSPEVRRELDFVFGSLAAALLLLLTICLLNAVSLLVSQALDRRPTWALMQALGAGPNYIVVTVAAEVVVLSLTAALSATALAAFLGRLLPHVRMVEYAPELQLFRGSWSVFLTTLAVSLVLGLACAVPPARLAARTEALSSLRTATGRQPMPAGSRRIPVLVQLGGSFALICLSLLFWRSLDNLRNVDLGLELRGVITATLEPGALGYEKEDYRRLFAQLIPSLREVPSIESLAVGTTYPFHGSIRLTRLLVEDSGENAEPVAGWRNWVTAEYFETVGVPLVAGRDFYSFETLGAAEPPRIAVLSRNLAEKLWPGESPLGKYVKDLSFGASFEIVGLVEDHKTSSITRPAPMIYFPLAPNRTAYSFTVVMKSRTTPEALQRRLDDEVRRIDPRLAVYNVQSLRDRLSERFSRRRMLSWTVPLLAAVALTLAACGVWGLNAGNVRRRRSELGIRMALGATSAVLQRKAVASAGILVALAALLGLAVLAALESWIAPNLYQVGLWDWPVLLASAVILAFSVGLSSVLALRRIASIDPAASLRAL